MKYKSAKIVCFSPTGTVRRVTKSIVKGIDFSDTEFVDITLPDGRKHFLKMRENELLIVGVPVYVGRIPSIAAEWLNSISADKTPVVCVVVYGNRDYDDALIELKKITVERGCIPVACGAFIGEHSFSSGETPASVGRPDHSDIRFAESFGVEIAEKLKKFVSIDTIDEIKVPGLYPYRNDNKTWVIDFIEVSDECNQCGLCAELCPVAAIDSANSSAININKCILCCACIKSCTEKARRMKPGLVKDAAVRVSEKFCERKEPEIYI